MSDVLVDSNVLLDVLTEDAQWYEWSSGSLAAQAERRILRINPIIYSEVSVGFTLRPHRGDGCRREN